MNFIYKKISWKFENHFTIYTAVALTIGWPCFEFKTYLTSQRVYECVSVGKAECIDSDVGCQNI